MNPGFEPPPADLNPELDLETQPDQGQLVLKVAIEIPDLGAEIILAPPQDFSATTLSLSLGPWFAVATL